MRRYAKRVESCHHRPLWRALRRIGLDITGHGWNGWLRTEKAMTLEALEDHALVRTIVGTTHDFLLSLPFALTRAVRWLLRGHGDPNARQWRRREFEGLCYTPLAMHHGRRHGARERVLEVKAKHPERLHIELHALATRVLFDAAGNATGVEYLKGERQYRAHDVPNPQRGELREVRAKREVILCGGAFNTPQLLLLSGIGPIEHLKQHNIPVRVNLRGVGRNLQDRYEVALTYRMPSAWRVLDGARFCRDDRAWHRWRSTGTGVYASNGSLLSIVRRSESSQKKNAPPDLFCMATLTRFEGYFAGFSKLVNTSPDYLTWVVLKAHTQNRAGSVTLVSNDARDMPHVNFRYFDEGNDVADEDLHAAVAGVKFVRSINAELLDQGVLAEEKLPGNSVASDADLADYVRHTAWGHHASCTCAIGPVDKGGVLDSNFKVHGVQRLRVVDASVFPRIPGFFIVSAVYMIAEKAADAILHDV
jgi:choline dehydrogenase-like flavoprotein